jgi:PAS domain S-box-containing protein
VDYLFKPVVTEVLQSKVSVFVELYRMRERARQQAIRQSEERFRLLVESIKDYSISMLNSEGIVTSWNPGARVIEGYEMEDVIGRHASCFFLPEDAERGAAGAGLQTAAATGRHEDEGWRLRKDGSTFWANVVITALKDESGKLSGFARVVRDLTERKATEERLRQLATELEQRVADRTQELVRSQHRLRDLATELTLTEQRERRRLAGELHDYLAQLLVLMRMKIRQAAPRIPDERATALLKEADHAITESLNYTRSLVAELAPPALQEFGLLEGFTWLAEQMQTHGLTVEIKKGLPRVVIPDDQAVLVFQSVRELLFNVLKHAGTGQAELSVEIDAGGRLVMAVVDHGQGFEVSELAGRNDERKRFGLFSVRERMEAMGGKFELESDPTRGTRAMLILPYWPDKESAQSSVLSAEQGETQDSALSTQHSKSAQSSVLSAKRGETQDSGLSTSALQKNATIRVLLADDHAMVRQGLRSILDTYRDVTVIGEAADGEEAVELTGLLSPDVVIMDVNMAKMDGIEATRRIKARWPSIMVIGLSFSNRNQVESLLLQAGASCYVSKDAAADRLYEAVIAVTKPDAEPCSVEKTTVSPKVLSPES